MRHFFILVLIAAAAVVGLYMSRDSPRFFKVKETISEEETRLSPPADSLDAFARTVHLETARYRSLGRSGQPEEMAAEIIKASDAISATVELGSMIECDLEVVSVTSQFVMLKSFESHKRGTAMLVPPSSDDLELRDIQGREMLSSIKLSLPRGPTDWMIPGNYVRVKATIVRQSVFLHQDEDSYQYWHALKQSAVLDKVLMRELEAAESAEYEVIHALVIDELQRAR